VIIGWIAVEIAFGHSGHPADQSGATLLVASTPSARRLCGCSLPGSPG
jgi:hypothetical protein